MHRIFSTLHAFFNLILMILNKRQNLHMNEKVDKGFQYIPSLRIFF